MIYLDCSLREAEELATEINNVGFGRTLLKFGNGDFAAYIGAECVAYWEVSSNMPLSCNEIFRIIARIQAKSIKADAITMAKAIDSSH